MWDVMLRRWLDLLFWWVPGRQQTPRRAESAPRAREPAQRAAAPSPRAAPKQPARTERGAPRAAEPSRPAPKAAQPSARPAAKPTAGQPEKAVAAPSPDDLTVIKGIGPAVQNRLRALGITTFADLAAANPDELMARLKGSQPLSRGRVQHWTEAARERART